MYEFCFQLCRSPASGAVHCFCRWGDVLHHCSDGVSSLLHVILLVAMSYSHAYVKERTSQLTDGIRIQNFVTTSSRRLLPVVWTPRVHLFCLCLARLVAGSWATALASTFEYDMTLGYPGEGPRWALI